MIRRALYFAAIPVGVVLYVGAMLLLVGYGVVTYLDEWEG